MLLRHWCGLGLASVLTAIIATVATAGDAPMEQLGLRGNQNLVRAVQQALAAQGYNPGTPDGLMGSKTIRAISEFQRAKNLTPTGNLDPETINALRLNPGR